MSRKHKTQRQDYKASEMMPRSRAMFNFAKKQWSAFSRACNKRWKSIDKDLLAGEFDDSLILGSGYFGIVVKTNNKKLVLKISSDKAEGYFNQIVLKDEYLRYSPGLPFILDCFYIPDWDAYVILRENVKFGVSDLPSSSPLARAIPALDNFAESSIVIETKVAKLLQNYQSLDQRISRDEFNFAFKEAQGSIRSEIIKTLKKIPVPSETSRYFNSIDVITHALDKYGIALWDLHNLNLGKHIYDMTEFDSSVLPLDTKTLLILDIGGNFGSPIMSQDIDNLNI